MNRHWSRILYLLLGLLLFMAPVVYAQNTQAPKTAEEFFQRGLGYDVQNKLPQAIDDYTRAIALDPKLAEAHVNRGLIYASQGKLPQAITDYNEAAQINPALPQIYTNRAVAYYQLKKYDQAWADVHQEEKLGITPDPQLIDVLKKASGH